MLIKTDRKVVRLKSKAASMKTTSIYDSLQGVTHADLSDSLPSQTAMAARSPTIAQGELISLHFHSPQGPQWAQTADDWSKGCVSALQSTP